MVPPETWAAGRGGSERVEDVLVVALAGHSSLLSVSYRFVFFCFAFGLLVSISCVSVVSNHWH